MASQIYVSEKGNAVEAIQLQENNFREVEEFCGGKHGSFYVSAKGAYLRHPRGDIKLEIGDYICIDDYDGRVMFTQWSFENVYRLKSREINPVIENAFMYHRPIADQPAKYDKLRSAFKDLAYLIDETCRSNTRMGL